jgi:asparagine synthetase B (glutamine-hydrolysing)
MPILAGWLTGEQVPQDIIQETLLTMGEVLGAHGGEPARTVQPGVGLMAYADAAYAMQRNDEPPVLDWVPDRHTLVYRRPLSGLHPLYYIENWPAEGNLLFASEIKALLSVGVPRRLHLPALDALLHYGFIPAPWTAFKDIYVVPAGSILRWQRAKTVVNHATDYHLDEPLAPNNPLEQLHSLLDDAVAGMLPPHEQLITLTGGGRSSALSTILASHHTSAPFNVVSIGYKRSLSAKAWREAERIAEICQRPFLAITGIDQPEFWAATLAALEAPAVDTRPAVLHQLLHTSANETKARVAISGLGAHILSNSAPQAFLQQSAQQEDILRRYSQKSLSPSHPDNFSSLWSSDTVRLLQEAENWEDTLHARKLARQAAKFTDQKLGWYYLDLHLRLPDFVVSIAQQLATQEMMAMRSPYLNADIIDMLTRLPSVLDEEVAKTSLIDQLVLRYMPDSPATASPLPLSGPITSLQQIDNSELLQQTISAEAIRTAGIFNPQVVENLLHEKITDSNRRALLVVFTTQLFCQLFGVGL